MTTLGRLGFILLTVIVPVCMIAWALSAVWGMVQPIISALGGR